MDWGNFQSHGQAPTRAFEAFAGILFERWIERHRGTDLDRVIFINGAGGDGGVESLAFYADGTKRGLQAKWFRRPLETNEIGQIRGSIKTALEVHPELVEYVIAVPRDLAHPKRKAEEDEEERNTERDRLDALAAEFPSLTITLWGDGQFEQLVAEVGSDGLVDYWFDRSVIRFEDLELVFEQARSGWLKTKYLPDLHTAGQIERDLSARTNGLAATGKHVRELATVRAALEAAVTEVRRVPRFPFFASIPEGEALVQSALQALQEGLAELGWVAAAIREGTTVERRAPKSSSLIGALRELLKAIPPQNERGIDSTKAMREILERCRRVWSERETTPAFLDELQMPVAYLGEPGSGKTHALAAMVHTQLSRGLPALLIRARDRDANDGFEKLLRDAVGEPTWNQEDILDALESSAVLAHVRDTSKLAAQQTTQPTRFLLAFDGLDESPNAEEWKTRLGEVKPLASRWSRVCFAFSMRPSLQREVGVIDGFSYVNVHASDADLATIFRDYTSRNRINCPPVLRWALQSPLAIRLFAELYENQQVDFSTSSFTLEALLDAKLRRVETSLREAASEPWDRQLEPVQRALQGFIAEYVRQARPLTSAEATKAALDAQEGFASLDDKTVGWILERLRDYGLLLVSSSRAKNFGPYTRTWEPAFEALTDFLLASEARTQLAAERAPANIPAFLRRKPDAATVTIAMLGADGFDRLTAGLWSSDLTESEKERLQRVALLHGEVHEAGTSWAKERFLRSMPSCRELLAELVVPRLRLPQPGYGGMFVHEALVGLSVQERDQFWSVPYWLPRNHGARWEGSGPHLDDLLEIAEDDNWDGMPLVAAWAMTSCNNALRRLLRRRLAEWATDKPDQLLKLLEHAGRTNDPQMLEDLLWVTHGAASLSTRGDWGAVCDWLMDSAARFHEVSRWNVEIEHARRAVIEYFRRKGSYERDLIDWPTDSSLLPLDPEAAKHKNKPWIVGALDRDLVWYVIPAAHEPFFDHVLRLRNRSRRAESTGSNLETMPAERLKALARRSIRPTATAENRKKAKDEVARREAAAAVAEREAAKRREASIELVRWFAKLTQQKQEGARSSLATKGRRRDELDRFVEMFGKEAGLDDDVIAKHAALVAPLFAGSVLKTTAATGGSADPTRASGSDVERAGDLRVAVDNKLGLESDEEHDDPDDEQDDLDDEHDAFDDEDEVDVIEDELPGTSKAGPPEVEAAIAKGSALLKAHADTIGFSSLTAEQLALGYCHFRVLELGWDKSIHYKEPKGEEPGEVLGLDIAILRRYPQASHGERSTVSTMAEKYCWIARHELVGYLARRLAAERNDELLPAPVDPANFVETPSPATDVTRPSAELEWPESPFSSLAPARNDIAESSQIAMANEWVSSSPPPRLDSLLRLAGTRLPADLRPHEWVVVYAFSKQEDPETMGQSLLWTCAFACTQSEVALVVEDARAGILGELQEFQAGLSKVEFYSDPSEVVWAPWFTETYGIRRHRTFDRTGASCEIELRALSCSFHWTHEEHEEQLAMPSRWLLERMGVTHVKHGRFFRTDGTVVAIRDEAGFVLARTDLLREALASQGMSLCWGARVFREPNTLLYSDHGEFARWNWYGIGVYSGSTIESHTISSGLEERTPARERRGRMKAGPSAKPTTDAQTSKAPKARADAADKAKADKAKADKAKTDKAKTDKAKADKAKTDKAKTAKAKANKAKAKPHKAKADKAKAKASKANADKTKADKTKADKARADKQPRRKRPKRRRTR